MKPNNLASSCSVLTYCDLHAFSDWRPTLTLPWKMEHVLQHLFSS